MTNSRDELIQPTDVGDFRGFGVLKVLLHMQLTGAGDFGRERGDTTLQKTKLHINPTNTFFFCHFHEIFSQTYFFWLFAGKKTLGCRVN